MSKFHCVRCGDSFDADPRLTVPCPDCQAPAGSKCVRPSEHVTDVPHKRRRTLAFQRMPCACLKRWLAAHPEERVA